MRLIQTLSTIATVYLLSLSPAAHAQEVHGHDHKHGEAVPVATDDHDHEHGHHHEAPHGGTLVAFGDEAAHLELVLDSSKGKLTGYVLDGEAVNAIRITQPVIELQVSGGDIDTSASVILKPVSSPLTGEKPGNTSQFEAVSDALKGKKQFQVTVEDVTIKGQNFKSTKSKFPEGNH